MRVDVVRRSWGERWAMSAVFVANGLSFGAWAGNLPRLRAGMGLSDASLGVVLLFVSVGAVGAMQVAGRFASRLGLVRSCWVGALVLGGVLPLPALMPGYGALVGSAVVLGFAMGWVDVCMNAHAAGLERRWGAAIMSSFHAGWSLGQLLGAGLAGVLAGAGLGLAGSLAVAGGVIGGAGLAGLGMREGGEAPERVSFTWPNRATLALCAVIGVSFAVEAATADWSGVYLSTALGATAGEATTGLAVFAVVMVACRLVGDWTVRRLGAVRVVGWGGLVAAGGLAWALVAPGVWWAAGGFALVGLGLANVVPVVFSAAGRRGAAGVAMVSTAGYGAVMLSPPLIGFVSEAVSLRAGLGLVVVAALGMAALCRRVG